MKRMAKKNAAAFGNNYFFVCPKCNCKLRRLYTHLVCSNNDCRNMIRLSKIKATCNLKDCENMSVALCKNDKDQWESRCQEHLGENPVKAIPKPKMIAAKKVSEKNLRISEANRTQGKRVIRKGEFPGQHIGFK